MRSGLFAVLAVLALVAAGCMTTGRDGQGPYKLSLTNRSNEILQDVVIADVDRNLRHFGYAEPLGHEKIIDNCKIDLKSGFGIRFYVDGGRQITALSLSQYFPVRDRIKTFRFFYLGRNEWAVVACDAAGKGVKPAARAPKR